MVKYYSMYDVAFFKISKNNSCVIHFFTGSTSISVYKNKYDFGKSEDIFECTEEEFLKAYKKALTSIINRII